MATTGCGILESDAAHDIHDSAMRMFDDNVSVAEIAARLRAECDEFIDDSFEYDLRYAAYILALWELGGLDASRREEFTANVNDERWASEWREEGEEWYEGRKNALHDLVERIAKPAPRRRKRRVERPATEIGELFELDGATSKWTLLLVGVERGKGGGLNYLLAPVVERNGVASIPGKLGEIRGAEVVWLRVVMTEGSVLTETPERLRSVGRFDIDRSRLHVTMYLPAMSLDDIEACCRGLTDSGVFGDGAVSLSAIEAQWS